MLLPNIETLVREIAPAGAEVSLEANPGDLLGKVADLHTGHLTPTSIAAESDLCMRV